MKTINKTLFATALFTAFAGAAAPALANDQLARSLGVEPGQYTIAELAIIKGSLSETGNEAVVFLENTRFAPTRSIHNPTAMAHFERAAEASDRNN